MRLSLQLTITPQTIRLDIPEQKIRLKYPNVIAYERQKLTLLSYGKSESELRTEMGANWLSQKQHVVWAHLFDPKASGPIFDYKVLEYILQSARRSSGLSAWHPIRNIFHVPIEIQAEIQYYDQLSLGRRRELEYYLQDFQRAQRLLINGEDKTIPPGWRYFQFWSGLLVRILAPSLLLFIGFLKLFNQWGKSFQQWIGEALIWIALALLAYFLGTAVWLLFFRKHLPHGYLRYQLRTGGTLLRRPTRWLADKIL